MRRKNALRICGLLVLGVPICLHAFSSRPWPFAVFRPSTVQPPDSSTFQYEIPLCSINGIADKNSPVSAKLEASLQKDLGGEKGDRVVASNASRQDTENVLHRRRGTFDLIIIEEEIRPLDKVKVIKAKLRIEAVSPAPGHRPQVFYDGIEPCFQQPDEQDEGRCTAQLVEDVKDFVIAHDKDCHRGNPCSQ